MRLTLLSALLVAPAIASGHELWIEPLEFTIEPDGKFQADIVNGQNFTGARLAYLPNRIEFFGIFSATELLPVESRIGNRPAIKIDALPEGLNVVAYQSTPAELTYDDPQKFSSFLAHKDLGFTIDDHFARGLTDEKITEVYTRYSKSLVAVGESAGTDHVIGLETEFVSLGNPYTDAGDMLPVQLFYRDEVRANAQIEIFDRGPDGDVAISTTRTDDKGIAQIPLTKGHTYMLDAVVMRIPSDEIATEYSAMWESLWANLTFYVPD